MILCVDLDDTIASSGKTIVSQAVQFDKDFLKRSGSIKPVHDCEDYYYFAKMLNWSRNDLIKFFNHCYPMYLTNIKVKYNKKKYLRFLSNLNIKIYIITSRREIGNEIVKNITLNWLNTNKVFFDKLYINVENKEKLIKEINPDFYIDDSLQNCNLASNYMDYSKIFLMNTEYNKNLESKYKRIKSIKDFYNIVKDGDICE